MSITIRKAEPKDAPALGHVQVTSWRSAFRNIAPDDYLDNHASEENQAADWNEILTSSEQIVYVAEAEGKLIGYVWAYREKDETIDWDAELTSLHLLPQYKRKGLGKALMSAAARELKNRGCESLYLWVLDDNRNAVEFYNALGGTRGTTRTIDLGGNHVTETIYSWNKIEELILG